jgi:hypothetical protein
VGYLPDIIFKSLIQKIKITNNYGLEPDHGKISRFLEKFREPGALSPVREISRRIEIF